MGDVNLIPAARLAARRCKRHWWLWATIGGVYGALVVIGSLKIWSHFENTRLLLRSTLRRS
jgi:uncharacterized membrane protein YdcZ (DUF606 family)